jgi:class 3 adenylate cyclase
MSLYFDFDDPQMLAKVAALQPTTGTCILIDISGSTAMKDGGLLRWVSAISNTFANARAFFDPIAVPIKSIGDELMLFIPDSHLEARRQCHLNLFGMLAQIAQDSESSAEPGSLFPEVKVAACHCSAVYELTFMRGTPDVYGKDIDLAARLLSQAQPREVVMNDAFTVLVRSDYTRFGSPDNFPEVPRIVGPSRVAIKGFAAPVSIFSLPAS